MTILTYYLNLAVLTSYVDCFTFTETKLETSECIVTFKKKKVLKISSSKDSEVLFLITIL